MHVPVSVADKWCTCMYMYAVVMHLSQCDPHKGTKMTASTVFLLLHATSSLNLS